MSDADSALLDELAERHRRLREAIALRIRGQEDAVEALLTALFAGGHALLIGAPGLAKTLLVSTVGDALGWQFKRIQFTPDLMPADITGSDILREDRSSGERRLEFVPGPIFANLILADEINRTPPKTQAALLEAMQERAVTAGGTTRPLPDPFFVLATQNPIEQEGTYPLPEAQLDRFLLAIRVDYPERADEIAIAGMDLRQRAAVEAVMDQEDFRRFQDLVGRLPVPDVALHHAVDLCRASRPKGPDAPDWVRQHVAWGAGPRAAQALVAAAKARAALDGEGAVDVGTVRAVAGLVLAHRVVPSFHAAGAGIDGPAIVARLLDLVPA